MRAAKFIHLALILISGFATMVGVASAQSIVQVCNPTITVNRVVATAAQRKAAGEIAQPPLTDQANGFAWPDTPLGVIKTEAGYTFFWQRRRIPLPATLAGTLLRQQQVWIGHRHDRHTRPAAGLLSSHRRDHLSQSRSRGEPFLFEL
jgi:hypothetical protein